MANGDIYRITLVQRYGATGPLSHNVFYYKQVTAGLNEGAANLLPAFQTQVYPQIDAIQNVIVNTLQIRVENIVPSADNITADFAPGTEVGQRPGDCTSPFVCWAFRLNRVSSAVRNGQKRFMGVGVDDQDNGIATAAMTPLLVNLELVLDNIIGGPPPGTATYQPRIFRAGKPSVTIPEKIIPAKLQADFDIQNAVFVAVTSQTSRKFGVGI